MLTQRAFSTTDCLMSVVSIHGRTSQKLQLASLDVNIENEPFIPLPPPPPLLLLPLLRLRRLLRPRPLCVSDPTPASSPVNDTQYSTLNRVSTSKA